MFSTVKIFRLIRAFNDYLTNELQEQHYKRKVYIFDGALSTEKRKEVKFNERETDIARDRRCDTGMALSYR